MSTDLSLSTDALAAHLDDPSWVVFDCRHDLFDTAKGERLYREGHIPGARFAHLDTDLSGEKTGRNGRHPLPAPAAFAAFLARNGVSAATQVVAYDDVGGQFAARLWWLCRWVGHDCVALLDGGYPKWLTESRRVERTVPVPTPTAVPPLVQADMQHIVHADDILLHLDTGDRLLIDARAPERYRGEVEPIDPVAGHIPGARNRFYKENLQADLTLKPVAALRASFAALLGATPPSQVVHHCGSGVTACANLFAMEVAGLTGSRLYAGSWSEWVADPARPVVKEPPLA